MRELDAKEDPARDGSASVVCLRTWREMGIPATPRWLQETSAGEPGDTGDTGKVDQGQMTSIDEQLEMLHSLAQRHYPDSESERNACLVQLLTTRLRQYAAMFQGLPVREMRDE
jgi:hypothetical protein